MEKSSVKGLFSFVEPTRVEDRVSAPPASRVVAVYLTSENGFRNYCESCPMFLMVQESGALLRVFCGAEKCQK